MNKFAAVLAAGIFATSVAFAADEPQKQPPAEGGQSQGVAPETAAVVSTETAVAVGAGLLVAGALGASGGGGSTSTHHSTTTHH
ncbi:MAG: hypothetical protein JNJ60_24530 [Rhodocyclaceae bacterium]|nr:hypothetical protein [Rhodocyclaceae bacterium]